MPCLCAPSAVTYTLDYATAVAMLVMCYSYRHIAPRDAHKYSGGGSDAWERQRYGGTTRVYPVTTMTGTRHTHIEMGYDKSQDGQPQPQPQAHDAKPLFPSPSLCAADDDQQKLRSASLVSSDELITRHDTTHDATDTRVVSHDMM